MRTSRFLFLSVLAFAVGCEQQVPMVYVLEAPQAVTLTTSASPSKAQQGAEVVLHAQRRTSGKWKQIPRDKLLPGQCWVYRPPAQSEAEVAGSLEWEVVPERGVQFHSDFQMDQTRIATVLAKGTVKLTPFSGVTCEKDRRIKGPAIVIKVS